MKKYLLLIVLITATFIAAIAGGKTRVWDAPDAVMNRHVSLRQLMRISRVELTPEETVVYLTVKTYPGNEVKFVEGVSLMVDTVSYPAVSTEGLTLGKKAVIPNSGMAEYVFRFPPLPKGVKSFDFIEVPGKKGFNFYGVHERTDSQLSTNWRDDTTGEWLIGFMPDKAIYDSRLWDYVEADFARGRFLLSDGNETVRVEAGRQKRDGRTFTIARSDGSAPRRVQASRITGMNLGFYPQNRPGVTEFANNGYVPGDSVTISGYLVNLPAGYLKQSGEMTVMIDNLITETLNFSAPIDSIGYFSLKFPVDNTQSIYLDPRRLGLNVPVEPGKEYFFFCDFSRPQLLWMGDRSRLLNELMIYELTGWPDVREFAPGRALADRLKSINDAQIVTVDYIASLHPSLSPLWGAWQKAQMREQTAFNAGQSLFRSPGRMITPEVLEYIRTTVVPELKDPLTAYNPQMLSTFLNNYFDDAEVRSPYCYKIPVNFRHNSAIVSYMSQPTYDEYRTRIDSVYAEIEQMKLSGADSLPTPLKQRARKLLGDISKADLDRGYDNRDMRLRAAAAAHVADSLGLIPTARDIAFTKYFLDIIDSRSQNLPSEVEDMAMLGIRLPYARDILKTRNDHYKKLASVDVETGNGEMVPADSLLSCKTGKEIFDRVLEPFRGRLVLIDVWGTWCNPCRRALKEFPEQRKELDPYGVVYMFFANQSEDRAWKNIIADSGVEGDNVVHYNLPANLQTMLENYLNVNSFPSYRLVNKDGSLVDVRIDHHSAERIIRQLSK